MLKQSFLFIFLQLLNLAIGLFTTLYVATKVDPITYSLLAIYIIVNGLYIAFTSVGYETVLIRNALNWKNKKENKLRNFITYALITRFFFCLVITFPILAYLYFIAEFKYDGNSELIYLFILSGIFSGLNNSIGLILKSFNRYIASFSVLVIGSLVIKITAFCAFQYIGFMGFLLVMIISPMIVFLISITLIIEYIDIKMIRIKYFMKFKRYISFGFLGYMKYLMGQSDRLIVSTLLSVELLASYSLAKQVQEIGKSFIEGFFDPLCQKAISYKGNISALETLFSKIKKINYIFVIIGIVGFILVTLFSKEILNKYNFGGYKYLDIYIISATLSSLFYLIYKVEGTLVSLFENPKVLFFIDLLAFVSFLSSLLIFNFLTLDYLIFISRVIIEIILMFIYILIWNKNKFKYMRSKII